MNDKLKPSEEEYTPTKEELLKLNRSLIQLINSLREDILVELKHCNGSDPNRIARLNALIKGIDMYMIALGYEKILDNQNIV